MLRRNFHPAMPPEYAACHDPLTIAIGAAVAGSVVSAFGAIQAGQAAAAAGAYNAQSIREQQAMQVEARNQQMVANQQLAGVQEAELRSQQAREAQAIRQRGRRVLATQRAGMAKAGVEITEGTPLEVLASQAREIELQEADSVYAADLASRRLRTGLQSENYASNVANILGNYASERRANLAMFEGQQAQTASYFQAGSSLLSGAGSVGRLYAGTKAI